MTIDPITALHAAASKNRKELELWLGDRLGAFVGEMEDAGFEIEDIPKELEDYAAWMRANMGWLQK